MKRKKELLVILSSLLVIALSVSVAYFTTKILGTGKEISVESADLKVIFTSGSGTINGTNIEPGWSSGENTFTVKNESNGTYKYNIIIKDLVNTFTTSGFLVYKITSADGGYNMTDFVDVPKSSTATDTILVYNISIEKGATHTYKVIFNYNNSDDVDQSTDMGKILSGKIFIEKYETTLISKLFENNPTISERTDFSTIFTTNTENTLYKSMENGTDVYYFSGIVEKKYGYSGNCTYNGSSKDLYYETDGVMKPDTTCPRSERECLSTNICKFIDGSDATYFVGTPKSVCEANGGEYLENEKAVWNDKMLINNWVKFGKNSNGEDLYWKIIRTNSDGGTRLLYFGNSLISTDISIATDCYFKDDTGNCLYQGQEYSNFDDSNIKNILNNWYNSTFLVQKDINNNLYDKYISSTAIFCNDKNKSTKDIETLFNVYDRIINLRKPTLNCSSNNQISNLKAGLLSADELMFTGLGYNNNTVSGYHPFISVNDSGGYAMYENLLIASMSPSAYSNTNQWFVHPLDTSVSKNIGIIDLNEKVSVRPVVNLNKNVKWVSGNGSAISPYEVGL